MNDGHPCHGNVVMMQFERRMVSLLLLLAVLGAPALGLRLRCAGHSCDEPVRATATIPFCSLPTDLRQLVANGFREGRSADVLAVASRPVGGGTFFDKDTARPEWPSVETAGSTRVPIAISAPGVAASDAARLPAGTGLDDVAPTVAALMGLERPHPEVRSGEVIEMAADATSDVRLVLQIVWKGVGSAELEAETEVWPTARGLVDGFGTMDATAGSLPLDPAAVLTTIGTGGMPSQHGITGSLLRDEAGRVREAWSHHAPVSVIAGLGDDIDELTQQRARVGMVADHATDRGLIGKDWYVDGDRDDFIVAKRSHEAEDAVAKLLVDGYGDDAAPDLLAVTLGEPLARMDKATLRLIEAALDAVGDEALGIVFTATGSAAASEALPATAVSRQVERDVASAEDILSATVPGGLYLNQDVIAQQAIRDDEILEALNGVRDRSGRRVFDDVFPAIAVSFGRYC